MLLCNQMMVIGLAILVGFSSLCLLWCVSLTSSCFPILPGWIYLEITTYILKVLSFNLQSTTILTMKEHSPGKDSFFFNFIYHYCVTILFQYFYIVRWQIRSSIQMTTIDAMCLQATSYWRTFFLFSTGICSIYHRITQYSPISRTSTRDSSLYTQPSGMPWGVQLITLYHIWRKNFISLVLGYVHYCSTISLELAGTISVHFYLMPINSNLS